MTVGRTEETRKEGREKRSPSVTALSTIAVQSGQTQVVVSVLKSGSSVHLQLVQVEPGLCEIGADQEENQTLIREQKQLLEKLEKHEAEVLSSVDKKRRQRGVDWLSEQRGPPEEQEGVYGAMKSSLKEGWTLLLRLLNRRLHTLSLTADFYHTVKEFAVGIEKLEDLEIQPGSLSDAQHSYISIRRDLLGKSLQLLGISSDLMRKLRDLQKTEALQRQGEVLQEEEEEDDQESAVCPLTCVLKLQEVVEALQDRRRTVDQEVKRQIQLAQNNSQIHPGEQGPVERQEWSLEEILAQNLSFTPEAESDLLLGSSPEQSEVSPNQTGANELKYPSNSSLMSTSSNENLGTAFELEEEQQLRVESRTENKKPRPAYGFEERQETVDDDPTSIKSLESLAEKNEGSLQELELEECMNFDAEPEIELLELKSESVEPCIKSSLHMENLSAMNLDEDIEEHIEKDWEKSSKFRSSSNVARIQQSDTKWESRPRSLPIFNLPSLQVHSEMRETNSLKLNTDELKQNLEDKRSNQDCSKDSAFQVFKVVENEILQPNHNNIHTASEELLIESSLKIDNLDSDINSYIPNEAVPEMERFSNENLMAISASKQEPLAKLEHRSRSLPVFNLVSTKLQPKLQESKDLLNIATNEMSTSFEEKPFENSNLQFEINSQCDAALMEEVEVSENIETENGTDLNNEPQMDEIRALYIDSSLKDIADLTIIPDQKTRDESQGISTSTSVEPTSMSVDQSEQEHDTPEKKLESFSERFKKLQSKWQEKEDVTMESKSTSYKVQNLNAVASNKPKEHSNKVSEEMNQWETEAQSSVVDNVMPLCFEEHSEEQLVHQTEVKTSVETVVKIETSTVEKYELAFDNSTSELKKEEPTCVHLEEIEKLCASCDQLTDKVCVWMEQCSCELSRSDPGQCLSEAQHTLNLNIQLQSEAQALEEEVQSMEHSLDQLRVQYPEVPARVESVVKHLNTVSSTIQSNLNLLGPYVSFLQAGEEVKAHFELLKQTYSQKPEMEETVEETKWLTAQDKFLITQELGNHFNTNLYKVEGAGLQQESMAHAVMETLVHLSEAKEEVEELHRHYQRQMQQLRDDRDYCLKYRDRLDKTVKDLQCVSELLDSCTVIDVGSEPHSSRLLQQFNQARPHFTQLDSEANFITCNFETLSRLQKRRGPLVTHTVTETDVSALLDLHLRLKQKIEESQSILELSSSFHLIIKQLEDLLQSKPITCGQGRSAEEKLNLLKVKKEQIHNVFNRAFNLKMDLCDGVTNSSVCGLRVQQLEACLHTVDSHRLAWLSEAARCEEKVLREMKTEALLHDIQLLRDSFKELKKRFSNLKINYVKRNDRSRNIKAVRNQLQQVDSFEDKLQSLKSRLQGLSARLQSEVKDGGSVRELEDLLNDLQRQMGESERNIKEHRKTLDMTCSLQEAMDEYQLWCEEASGTIARVGKFSTECRSTEAVAVLYRQFEKFVWPTVPQQEERISQITELAVRLHGADEGQRYIEKTVSKHSEMVAAIRALSDGLLELEEKLKVQSLKPQQKDEKQVEIKDSQMDESAKEKDTGKDMKVEEKSEQKEQMDNRTTQEAAEMYELKETGHTPELTNKHDGKETPARRHSFNKKPPLQKQRMHQDTDRLVSSSFCSTHTFSLSCSPLETNRQVFAISQGLPPPSSREALKVKREEPLNTTLDTGAGSLYETELHHHHEVLSEDSLSTDEYDCPSPDDISLPPLAETPESFLVQSDLEEGGYFGSQHSYRSHRESAENQHSVSRYRTESGSFVPSPLTVPIQTQVLADFTTTMHVIATEATTGPLQQSIHDNIPNQPPRNTEPIPQVHNPSLNLNFPTTSINISEEIPCLLPDKSLSNSFPVSKSSLHQEITSFEITKKSDQVLKDISADIELTKSKVSNVTSQNNPTTMFHKTQHRKDFTNALEHNPTSTALLAKKVGNESLKLSMIYPQKETVLCQESSKCGQQEEEAVTLIRLAACNSLTTAVIKETVYSQSSMSSRSLVQTVSDAAGHNEKVIEDIKLVAMNENDFPKPSKDCNDQMPSENKDIKERSSWVTFDDSLANPSQELRGASSKESASIDYFSSPHNATSSANNTVDIQQNHQTAYHETPTEQCVHDPGSNAPPEAQTQALTWRANTHATPSRTSSPHLLTPDQDPDVCQPCTIREEIRLTRQIKGPSLRPQGPEECSCFMRPVSQAAVMGGSPVTLEVEVAGQPEPKLTWCKDGTEEEERIRAANRTHEDGKATDGAVCEAWLAATGGKDRKNYSDDDDDEGGGEEERGVMAEIYNIMTADWQTWFGTLCFLLWLLFLIII